MLSATAITMTPQSLIVGKSFCMTHSIGQVWIWRNRRNYVFLVLTFLNYINHFLNFAFCFISKCHIRCFIKYFLLWVQVFLEKPCFGKTVKFKKTMLCVLSTYMLKSSENFRDLQCLSLLFWQSTLYEVKYVASGP